MTGQLDLFANSEIDYLVIDHNTTKEKLKNLRRGLFKRYDELMLEHMELKKDMLQMQHILKVKSRESEKVVEFDTLEA